MRAHHSLKNRERKGVNKKNTSRRLKKEMRGGAAAATGDTSWKYDKKEDNTTLKDFIERYWRFTQNPDFWKKKIIDEEYDNIIEELQSIAGDQYTGSLIVIQNYILEKLNEGGDINDIADNLVKIINNSTVPSKFMKDIIRQIIIFTKRKNELIRKLKQEMNTDTPTLVGLTDAHSNAIQGETIMETKIQVGTNIKGNGIESEKRLLKTAKDKIQEFKREITKKKQDYETFTTILEEEMNLKSLQETLEDAKNIELYGESIKIDEQVSNGARKKIAEFQQNIEKKKKELEGLINEEMGKENPDLETLKSLKERVKTESIVHGESIGIDELNTQLDAKIIAIDDADKLKKHKESLQNKQLQTSKLLESRIAEKRQKAKEAKQKREKRERRIELRRRAIVSAARDFKKNELINAIKEQIDSNDIDGMIEAYENAINVGTSDNPFSPKKRIEVEIDPTILEEKKKIIETKIKEQFEADFDKATNLEEMRKKIQNMKDNNRLDRYFVDVKNKCIKEAEQKLIRAKDEAERKAQQAADDAKAAVEEESKLKAQQDAAELLRVNEEQDRRAAAAAKAKAEAKQNTQQAAAQAKAQAKEQDTTTEPTIKDAAKKAAIAVAAAAAAVVKKIASDSINKLGSSEAAAETKYDDEENAEDSDSDSKREYKKESTDSESEEEGDDEVTDHAVKKKTKEAAAQVAIAVAAAAAAATKAIATKAIAKNEISNITADDESKKIFIVTSDGIYKKGDITPNDLDEEYETTCHKEAPCKVIKMS